MKTLLMATHENNPEIYYWDIGEHMIFMNKHDYAIVEDKQGISLVKIIGACSVKDDFPYGHKRLLKLINSKELKNE